MATFEEMHQKMQQMSTGDLQAMTEKNRSRCLCPTCPTHNDCMKGKSELYFCMSGRSTCTITKKACLCPNCPVHAMMGLRNAYYCARGAEKEIPGK